jgi:hypothetical protein
MSIDPMRFAGRMAAFLLACSAATAALAEEFATADRQRLFRNVKDFGAVGDGVADDTAAIQRAINHNQGDRYDKAGGHVFLPSGTYKITRRLTLWSRTYFMGDPLDPPTLLLPANTPDFQDPEHPNALIATWNGYNCDPEDPWFYQVPMPISAHDKGDPKFASSNNLFRVALGNFKIVIEPGNPGAVGMYTRLAQQTQLVNITVKSSGTQYGLYAKDCAGPAWFYGLGCEHQRKVPYYLENCRGFTLLCAQTETSPVDMVIDGCDRIVTLGKISGNWRGMWCSAEIRNSTNILMAGTTLCRTLYFLRDNPAATPPGAAVDVPELTVYGDPHPSRRWSVLGLYYRGDFHGN